MTVKLRPLRLRDWRWVRDIGADPEVRSVSVDRRPLTLFGHLAWMLRWATGRPGHFAWAILVGGQEAGVLRVGPSRSQYISDLEAHVAVAADWRGQGVGTEALRILRTRWRWMVGYSRLIAYVREDNTRALHAFRAAGWLPDVGLLIGSDWYVRLWGAGLR